MNTLPHNTEITVENTKWITTYQTMFGENKEQELIVDFRYKSQNEVLVRVAELHVENPYTQWFSVESIDKAFELVEEVKNCLS
jgi:hypothetical protein